MANTQLDRSLFVRYIESKWPLSKLTAYCTPKNVIPKNLQNLVPDKLGFKEWQIPVHQGKQHEFDKIFVYASEDVGNSNYSDSLAKNWRRWTYSLNMTRGKDHWTIIENLLNDFMENPGKYLPQPQVRDKREAKRGM
jgi:hypothetical protein